MARKKRRFERGSFAAETSMGKRKLRTIRKRGGIRKTKALREKQVNIFVSTTGKAEKTEILRVARNPANVGYDRRGVITKGALIETKLGLARVTSRPGQHGLINALLVEKEAKK